MTAKTASLSGGITSGKLAGPGATVADVIFRQFVDEDHGCASYLVGDESVGEAVLVDPAFRIEHYLEAAERHEVRLLRGLETPPPADPLSRHGPPALAHRL